MNLDWEWIGVAVVLVLFIVMLFRQRQVYQAYHAAQKEVLNRQAEIMVVQSEQLEAQREMVRLLQILASKDGP